ncbi:MULTISPECIES: hypothetical protein [Amycolatopsis]|uniref:Uncharacterized protein n=1 Tax=Amycolatopsis albidoflavus TaxID=102226 RepID=A0ABW5I7E7_9PSEU
MSLALGKGDLVAVSIGWVAMHGAEAAQRLKDLVGADGTGSGTLRAAIALDMGNVEFTGARRHSDRHGNGRRH